MKRLLHQPSNLSNRLVMACWLLLTACATNLMADGGPLNLLVIQTDEHHFGTLGCYGGKIVGTPHIDRIAAEGAICTSFYATTPVCSPSRAALVSGLYPQKTPVVINDVPMADNVVTFAELLRRRGYATGFAGKWHLDGAGKPQWAPKRRFGFEDNRFMFNRGHWKKFEDGPDGPRVGARNKQGPTYALDGADETTFSTDWLCNKAIDFVNEHHERPFCYMLSLPDPHGPNTVRAPYDTMYADVEVPIPATLKRTPQQTPGWGRPANVTAAQLRRLMPPYYGMVKCIDDNVGRILKTLERHRILDRTIVVFTSDHGDLCGEHGRLNKGVPYEGSARIPFLMRCPPRVPAGTKIEQALSCVDFLPTVMAMMEVDVPHRVDGRDAAAWFAGRSDENWRDMAILRSTSGKSPWLAAVSARYKLVLSAADEPWLIDLKNDPSEVVNLAGDPEHAGTVRTMTEAIAEYARQHQDDHARHPELRKHLAP
ncbi:MAG: sulfatase [Planctomycetales bacterium]|nr:sulfatase [Planctomycetales bacterium]